MRPLLGTLLYGSLSEGFVMRIASQKALEELKSGKFVSIVGSNGTFFSLITDLKIGISHPDITLTPPTSIEPLLYHAIKDRFLSIQATIRPMLMLDKQGKKQPVKTIPAHFAPVFEATSEEIFHIFGREDEPSGRYFSIGTPLDMTAPVCINLDALTERSTSIFGKTGTGKTFLTRLVLAGIVKSRKAVTVIFDMHSEYGLQARKEGGQHFVKGLKTLFPDRVAIFSLDPVSTRRRGGSADVTVLIPYHAITVHDIISLQSELNLHPTACEAANLIATKYGSQWLVQLFAHSNRLKELAEEVGAHSESVSALYRKIRAIERFPCFTPESSGKGYDVIEQMMDYINRGISVVIEFGNFTSTLCYLLVANIITRRLHVLYTEKTETFLGSQRAEDEPRKLIIVIEEAHKFLNPTAAQQTIFGTIAREMRKYYVSLLVVDQRPSGIDAEILSQIGTKIIAQLHDEKDIAAVLSGVPNSTELRTVLASLDSKKQVLLLGHAVPMPIVIETRTYDELFYKTLLTPITTTHVTTLINQMF